MPVQKTSSYEKGVFINCPFDQDYEKLFYALIFAIHDCGFVARCALEASDSGEVRISKIVEIIRQCKFGAHDISRTELSASGLPRFNMPLEFGLFLGAKEFDPTHKKICLILDRQKFRCQEFCSDIAGQDIAAHGRKIKSLIRAVRDWLQTNSKGSGVAIPGANTIYDWYQSFLKSLPKLCAAARLDKENLIFVDRQNLVIGWIAGNDLKSSSTRKLPIRKK